MKGQKHSVSLANEAICTGCGICAAICTHGCIRMKEGILGHVFPKIDTASCVGCGQCEHICPALHPQPLNPIQSAYASWSKDPVVYRSSASGGIATELSKVFLRNGGVVYGCAMLPNVDVRHVRVDKVEDLEPLKSSKYVHSSIIGVIPSLRKDIADGRQVLFIGTPCQVAAVKALYKVQPESLFLVDLICHGVPSLKMLKDYVGKVVPRNSCTNITFRQPSGYTIRIWGHDKELCNIPSRVPHYGGWYLDAFMDGYTMRDSCYHCPYASAERVGEMTLGDFWGLGQKTPADAIPDHPYGCSVVLPVSEKGLWLLDAIQPFIALYPREIREAIEGNMQLQGPVQMTKRIRFYRKVQQKVYWPGLYRWVNLDRVIKEIRKGC